MTDAIPVHDPDEAVPVITHDRDLIVDGDVVEQDYNFHDYAFVEGFRARAYLDEPGRIILHPPERLALTSKADVPHAVLAYLAYRFDRIEVLGSDGQRRTLWEVE